MVLELSASGNCGCVLVVARGECDITNASLLREQLLGMLARESARMVVDRSTHGSYAAGEAPAYA